MADLTMVEPPKIGDLTSEQMAQYSQACLDAYSELDAIEDYLMRAGFSQVHATSATAHIMLNAAARQALVTAMLGGREPNREWFLHNCASAFDRWVAAQTVDNKNEPFRGAPDS